MTSPKASLAIKPPQRQRGHARVESLLEAAGLTFAEKGYDATTMTQIALRAGASIGSLYQFFPTKELVAEALLERYSQTLADRLLAIRERAGSGSDTQFARRLLCLLLEFRRDHPGFVSLSEAHNLPVAQVLAIRNSLRGTLAEILAVRAPGQSAARLRDAAFVVLHLMKAYVTLSTEPGIGPRKSVLAELQHLLCLELADLAA
jgi:AcrR family transcriptional regulator